MTSKLNSMNIAQYIDSTLPLNSNDEGYDLVIHDKDLHAKVAVLISEAFWELLDSKSSFSIYPSAVYFEIKSVIYLEHESMALHAIHKESKSLIFIKNMMDTKLGKFYLENKNDLLFVDEEASTSKTKENKEITDPVLKELNLFTAEKNVLSMPNTPLKNYAKIKKLLQLAGGKYVKNTFVFDTNDSAEEIKQTLVTGEKLNDKKKFQFFATTEPLSIKLVNKLNIQANDKWCEPSAGQGAIADKMKAFSEQGTLIELMDKNINVLKEKGYTPIEMDFLKVSTDMIGHKFDKIGANPPFTKDQDIIHIKHMYDEHLAEKGTLSSYASQSWLNGLNKRQVAFRAWIKEVGAEVELIDSGEFKESGTSVATSLITIQK